MVKVVATAKGYFGGIVREVGQSFDVPAEIWNDPKRKPRWATLDPSKAFGGKGDHDGDGKVGGSKPANPAGDTAPGSSAPAGETKPAIVIPADWQNLSAKDRKALADSITGEKAPNAAEADKIIVAYLETIKAEPFGDAPAPQTIEKPAGNGLQTALGGVAPDWVAPGSSAPKAVAD